MCSAMYTYHRMQNCDKDCNAATLFVSMQRFPFFYLSLLFCIHTSLFFQWKQGEYSFTSLRDTYVWKKNLILCGKQNKQIVRAKS